MQIAQVATKVAHTTRAQRQASIQRKPPELKEAQIAIFTSPAGPARQSARRVHATLKQKWEALKLRQQLSFKPKPTPPKQLECDGLLTTNKTLWKEELLQHCTGLYASNQHEVHALTIQMQDVLRQLAL